MTLEESVQANDIEIEKDGFQFIIDKDARHYFENKTLDYIPDKTGFKQFEIV